MRSDGRKSTELRKLKIERSYLKYPEGSAHIELGDTRVICTASVEEKVPTFLKGAGQGWVTAEYSMLPRSTEVRVNRERGSASSRSLEIQRLIGRSLRAVVDLSALGERTIKLDCDVIQADGGTRTASISGAYVALAEALFFLIENGLLDSLPFYDYLSAVSVGLVEGSSMLDLAFEEDSRAEVDMNVVMTATGKLVEIQGSAEEKPFSREEMNHMLDLADEGIKTITALQQEVLGTKINAMIKSSIELYAGREG